MNHDPVKDPKLGFGLMRLPRLEGSDQIDIPQTSRMVDLFLEAGMTYFDTAYVYHGSEDAACQALVKRHPRGSYTIADKLNAGAAKDEEDARQQIFTSLKRLGTDYLDYYLLHAVSARSLPLYDKYGLWEYQEQLKEKGLVRHIGFSFHDSPELLDKVLSDHPAIEFVQLQINYADWDDPRVQSRRNYETARRHGKPVVIMEPVKGGTLSSLPSPIAAPMKAWAPDASLPSWAIRFAASLEGVLMVLSGMSSVSQMQDNLSFMKDFRPLDEKERAVILQVQKALANVHSIKCTSCHYCTDGCPMKIDIPSVFSAMNLDLIYGNLEKARQSYSWNVSSGGKASQCIRCGQCEEKCPQHLPIRDLLATCAARLEV